MSPFFVLWVHLGELLRLPGWVRGNLHQYVAHCSPLACSFDAILAMRQSHGIAFGKSDMFFLIALKPEPGQEVRGGFWMECVQ